MSNLRFSIQLVLFVDGDDSAPLFPVPILVPFSTSVLSLSSANFVSMSDIARGLYVELQLLFVVSLRDGVRAMKRMMSWKRHDGS